MSARLTAFVEAAPPGSLRALTALAAAESLTDELASQLIEVACPEHIRPDIFVSALHLTGFLVERNSEWHLSGQERLFLNKLLVEQRDLFSVCHAYLADIADAKEPVQSLTEIPNYLRGPVGKAYHHTALFPAENLSLYKIGTLGPLSQQWLAARLATEQQELGVLPPGVIEPAFLRGMVLYREGNRDEAVQVLRSVAYSKEIREEVAIAAHLVGRRLGRRNRAEAERLLRRSLKIGEELDHRHHQAQVLHTLGQHLRRRNPQEAERLLRRSLALLTIIGDRRGQGQVLHTLGQNLWRKSPEEAEDLLRRSLAIKEAVDDQHGQAQVLHTLGQNLWKENPRQAERLLRRSLEIGEEIGNHHHQAQVLHTLGQNVWTNNPEEAEGLLRRSLAFLIAGDDRHGEAQVLHTLGSKLMESDRAQAEELLSRSLRLGEETGNLRHRAMVSLTLGKLLWTTDRERAEAFILRSLELNRMAGDRDGERLVLREMRNRGIAEPAAE